MRTLHINNENGNISMLTQLKSLISTPTYINTFQVETTTLEDLLVENSYIGITLIEMLNVTVQMS